MSSTRKNNTWHFGAKGHIGVQAQGRPVIHSTEFSTAKDNDIQELEKLLHGKEKAVFGDSAYVRMADKHKARADGVYYGISDRGFRKHPLSGAQKKRNRRRSSVRARVEHPFRVIRHLWGHYKLRYKGPLKNAAHGRDPWMPQREACPREGGGAAWRRGGGVQIILDPALGGNLKPRKPGPKKARKLDWAALRRAVEKQPEKMKTEWAGEFRVGTTAINYALRRMNLSRKKNVAV